MCHYYFRLKECFSTTALHLSYPSHRHTYARTYHPLPLSLEGEWRKVFLHSIPRKKIRFLCKFKCSKFSKKFQKNHKQANLEFPCKQNQSIQYVCPTNNTIDNIHNSIIKTFLISFHI